jgi:hypothetical protein
MRGTSLIGSCRFPKPLRSRSSCSPLKLSPLFRPTPRGECRAELVDVLGVLSDLGEQRLGRMTNRRMSSRKRPTVVGRAVTRQVSPARQDRPPRAIHDSAPTVTVRCLRVLAMTRPGGRCFPAHRRLPECGDRWCIGIYQSQ